MRTANQKHELPPDPVFKEIPFSDGDTSTWPQNTTRIVQNGEVNYMLYTSIDEGMPIKWRIQVGAALANAYNWPKGPNYVLQDWPANYRMFIHHKGPSANPRQDVYLFGSTNSPKFRSVPEFIPHAIWLYGGRKSPCECKYCGKKKSQREITADMGERGIIEMSPALSASAYSPSRPLPAKRASKLRVTYAAVQKTPKQRRKSNFLVPSSEPYDQVFDLQNVHGGTALDLRKWYRNDELVWFELDTPIVGSKGNGDVIRAWPAIVEGSVTRSRAIPKDKEEIGPSTSPSISSHPNYDPNDPPWTIHQFTDYKLKLLGTSCYLTAPDHQVLPYQAYLPPTELIEALQDVSLSDIKFELEYTSQFSPVPVSVPEDGSHPSPTFEESTGPYALSIQIGAQLAGFWSLTDDWDFKFSYKHDIKLAPHTVDTDTVMGGLDAVISSASTSNALNQGSLTSYGTSSIYPNRPHVSPAEFERTKASVLGAPKPVGQTFSQKNFQGLWWGAERIWREDLIRVKLSRNALAPQGAPHIKAPSGPGANALASARAINGDELNGQFGEKDLGAGTRGIFMRLEALFTVDVELANGKKKSEVRAAGMLYELADEDWKDPEVKEETGNAGPEAVNGAPSGEFVNGMSNSLPLPAPLKPAALPNPDPTVPITETALSINAQINPNSSNANGAVPRSSFDPNNHAGVEWKPPVLSRHSPLPPPPVGYTFRPILDPGYEAVFSLTLLSGRYYPGILSHPLLSEAVETALIREENAKEGAGEGELQINPRTSHLWALEGLEAGIANSMDPVRYKKDRLTMLLDAEESARAQLREHLENNEEVGGEEKVEMNGEGDGSADAGAGANMGEKQTEPEHMDVDQSVNDRDHDGMQVDSDLQLTG